MLLKSQRQSMLWLSASHLRMKTFSTGLIYSLLGGDISLRRSLMECVRCIKHYSQIKERVVVHEECGDVHDVYARILTSSTIAEHCRVNTNGFGDVMA